MKDISLEALAVLIVLLPGFLSARLVQSFANRTKQSDFDKVVEALVYSFIIYLVYSLWQSNLPIDWKTVKESTDAERHIVTFQPRSLCELAVISMGLALVMVAVANHDLSGRILRFIRLSSHTSRPTIWADTFHEYGGGFIQVELKDGRRVLGWVLRYSGSPEESTLFLSHAHWVSKENNRIPIPGKGILLTKASGIKDVMFLDTPTKIPPISSGELGSNEKATIQIPFWRKAVTWWMTQIEAMQDE